MKTHTLRGTWTSTKGKLRQRFPELTEDDLFYAEGREDELLRRIEERTGLTREDIEFFLEIECGCVELPTRARWNNPPAPDRERNDEQNASGGHGLAGNRDARTASVGEQPQTDPDASISVSDSLPTPPPREKVRPPVEESPNTLAQEEQRSTGISGMSSGV